MCECGGQKNQTSKMAFKFLADKKINARSEMGAGLFLLPDPEAGPLRYRKVFVHDLSYVDVQLRGIHCSAFKWFPYSWMDKSALAKIDLNPEDCYKPSCQSDADCGNVECFCAGSAGCA
jgi:hypothetical protein